VIPAPYWGQPGHLGWTRVSRFVRWLGEAGVGSVVARAGSTDRVDDAEFGEIVTVRDPLGFYRDLPEGGAAIPLRRKSRLRRTIAYLLLVPDPLVPWSRRAARHPLVLDRARGAELVLASSPPESAHVAAAALATRLQARLVVDLRDGWLDEPMIPLLEGSRLQRARHRRIERRILRRAERIFVTSGHWRSLLCGRLPFTSAKTTVLTNACPRAEELHSKNVDRPPGRPLTLLYTGKISSSRPERRVAQLMSPLLAGLGANAPAVGRLVFVGNLDGDEQAELEAWRDSLAALGWTLEIRRPVPRDAALRLVGSADGLLLLSSSMASLPAKLFDYLPSGRPILVVAPEGSAIAEVVEGLPQVVPVSESGSLATAAVRGFLSRCQERDPEWAVPESLSEEHVRAVFLRALAE